MQLQLKLYPSAASIAGLCVTPAVCRASKARLHMIASIHGASVRPCKSASLTPQRDSCASSFSPVCMLRESAPMSAHLKHRQREGSQDAGRALGATIAALGLSNKAVYDDGDDDDAGPAELLAAYQYPDGPDIAPGSMPSAVAGEVSTTAAQH